ncbi:M20/M25/M40 family metallo-hydrolase [Granulicella tundricola]|uniref:Peptidase M20 n=1 Tax=Granulicella tundricola (strain ATCC BAA-1859 / DSM 23138 / MP5ACTX9) TaxID=1198114 RepID=E8X214_GRATM|nr:M20/M25/M40 family metallo-hydrolase [Granulicella tundricola]ADW70257.1 peptidase M20 [Granulicella tundricola MP5ACTX9]
MKLQLLLRSLCCASISAAAFAQTPQAGMLSADASAAEMNGFLRDLVRIDTRNPPGDESKVANYIAKVFQQQGIPYELLEPVPGRASLVARLKGDGSKKPVLLLAHEDVVPVDRAHWTVEPFGAETRDGVLYGRGASDDKSPLAAHLETMLQLHRSGKTLTRDVIFLAEASEEQDSAAGMHTIVERYWDKVACEFAINEGGAAEVKDGKVAYLGVATGEKMPRGVRLVAKGKSGHASVPVLDNAVTHLAQAVARLGTWETPVRLNETTTEFFSRLAGISTPADAKLFRSLNDPKTQMTLHKDMPQFYSMLHTSVVPTVLKAGFKSNVIPSEAEAQIDIRALPDENMPAFYAQMAKIIDDPSITIVPPDLTDAMPAAPASSLRTPMFEAFDAAQKDVLPEAITIPVMSTGATDSAFLRAKGVNAYGIRVPRTFAENEGVHGNNERIQLKYVAVYQRFVQAAVEKVAR